MYTKKETEELANKVNEIHKLIDEAQAFADQHQISFALQPSFGIGGTYYPQTPPPEQKIEEWNPSFTGWLPSNSNC